MSESGFGFDELRSTHRKERNITSLSEMPQDFYKDLAGYINRLYNEAKEGQDLGKLRLLENTVKVARDIAQRRVQKILTKALKSVRTGVDDPKNMTDEEKALYHALMKDLKEFDSFVEAVVSGRYEFSRVPSDSGEPPESPPSAGETGPEAAEVAEEDRGEMLINETSQNLVLARVVKDIPGFVAPDGNEYGPYQPDEIVRLPEDVANILVDQGLIEIL